jgi:hypothetical protein
MQSGVRQPTWGEVGKVNSICDEAKRKEKVEEIGTRRHHHARGEERRRGAPARPRLEKGGG